MDSLWRWEMATASHKIPGEKFPFPGGGGLCPGRMANDAICRASAPHLTATSPHDGKSSTGGHYKVRPPHVICSGPCYLAGRVTFVHIRFVSPHLSLSYIFPLISFKHTYFSFWTDASGDWLCAPPSPTP